uniref:Uncharacterized protein n=1 Tax=Knipowitschia caucasica TaxID=637954 RepID=A0AAV2LZ50_KNICA
MHAAAADAFRLASDVLSQRGTPRWWWWGRFLGLCPGFIAKHNGEKDVSSTSCFSKMELVPCGPMRAQGWKLRCSAVGSGLVHC